MTTMAASEFDIHTHTIASGHAATITDMAKAAVSRNLKLLDFRPWSGNAWRRPDHLIFEI